MPYFGKTGVLAITDVVTITGGYTVVVGMLTGKDSNECQRILTLGETPRQKIVSKTTGMKTVADETEQTTEMPVEFMGYRDEIVLRGIRSWDLDEENGDPAPVDKKHVALLLEADRNKIFLKIRELTDRDTNKSVLGE